MLEISNNQIILILFKPESPPPISFKQVAADVDTLVERIEQRMSE